MNREVHVRFWEGAGVKFSRATQLSEPERIEQPRSNLFFCNDSMQCGRKRIYRRPKGSFCHAVVNAWTLNEVAGRPTRGMERRRCDVRTDKESRYDDERRRAQAGKPYSRGD
jgi:hypothetical protein